ncbi:MAG: Zn-ribbon domain-containing OB-fold protein [Fervidicoccaceae archaeon]
MERLSISRFWRNRLVHYTFSYSKCKKCGNAMFPPKHTCSKCGSRDVDILTPPREGKLISWTKLYEVPIGFVNERPIYLGLVQLGEIKVMAQIVDVLNDQELKEGIEVEAVFRRVKEDGSTGLIYYALKFRPKKH